MGLGKLEVTYRTLNGLDIARQIVSNNTLTIPMRYAHDGVQPERFYIML